MPSGWVNKNMFDNSDFPKDSPYHDAKNKKVIGKFKDEAAGVPIVEFEGLRSKMYLPVQDNGKNEKTAKGVKKYVITKNIKHENYKDTPGADYLEPPSPILSLGVNPFRRKIIFRNSFRGIFFRLYLTS